MTMRIGEEEVSRQELELEQQQAELPPFYS
jgi:hypothetical protein